MNVRSEQIVALLHTAGVSADVSRIKGDMPLRDAGIDSLDMMNVFLAIEENFGIKIPDDDINKLDTVDNIVRYLQGR
jgi:acyl carrier protein